MAITHTKVSAIADGADPTLVRPSDWNANHTIGAATITLAMNVNVSTTKRVIGRNTAGAGVQEEVTASQLLDWASNTNGVLLTRAAGTWGALANVTTDNGDFVIAPNASPVTPSAGVKVFGGTNAGRQAPAFLATVGAPSLVQAFMGSKSIATITPVPGTATFASEGYTLAAGGTVTARALAATSFATGTRRAGMVSAAAAGSVAVVRPAANMNMCWRGNVTGAGGFHVVWRFSISDAALVATANMFVGVQPAGVPADVDPATLLNLIGVGCTSGDTVLALYAADGTARTKTPFSASFPCNTVSTDVYEFALYCPPNGADVRWQLTRLNTGDVASGTISSSTNMPASTVMLAPQAWRSNGGTATAVAIDLLGLYLESDN